MPKISNQPPKGTYDWLPREYAIRKYIFDTWRDVCLKFGYQEYLTPLVEYSEVYKAKSGDDVGGKELTIFKDRGDRELAIRPEMTPSVTRLVSKIYQSSPKPLKLFSIANFYRNEKPQKGRNREFWQLNFDMFGIDSIESDFEIIQMAAEILLSFNAPPKSFTIYINNRQLIDAIIPQEANRKSVVSILDKWEKTEKSESLSNLRSENLSASQIDVISKFMECTSDKELLEKIPTLSQNPGLISCTNLLNLVQKANLSEYVSFRPNIIRGFDYYNGLVFEVFDNNKQNQRSLFGGGRYDGLAKIYGSEQFPAVGCAPGDETTKLFLENWNLIPSNILPTTQVLVTVFSPELQAESLKLSNKIRQKDIACELYPDTQKKLERQLRYASEKNIRFVCIIGPDESKSEMIKVKDMSSQVQTLVSKSNIISYLQSCLPAPKPIST